MKLKTFYRAKIIVLLKELSTAKVMCDLKFEEYLPKLYVAYVQLYIATDLQNCRVQSICVPFHVLETD